MMRRSAYRHSPLRDKRRKKRTLIIALGFLVVVILFFVLVYAPFFQVEEVEVAGARTISSTAVQTTAKTELTGTSFLIFSRNSIFWFPKQTIAKKIHASSSTIKSVTVKLSFPRKIKIDIQEFTPEAVMCDQEEVMTCFLLDGGFAFATTTANTTGTSTILRIQTEPVSDITLKKQIVSTKRFVYTADLSKKLLQATIPVERITLQTSGDYIARIKGGAELYFSEDVALADAIKNVNTLLTSEIFKKEGLLPPEGFKKIDYIDLRFGNKLFYKTNGGNAHESNP